MKSLFRFLILAVLLLAAFACKKDYGQEPSQLSGRFRTESVVIVKDETYKFPFQISKNLGPYIDYDFEEDPYNLVLVMTTNTVLSYEGKGVVRALDSGSTEVRIWLNGKYAKMTVTVVGTPINPDKPMDPDSLALVTAPWNWIKPMTGVINHPCDNKKWTHDGERKDPTIFVAK